MKVDKKTQEELKLIINQANKRLGQVHIREKKKIIRGLTNKFLKEKLAREKKKITITSTYSLTQPEIERIINGLPFIKGSFEKIENIVTPAILAGVIVKYGSRELDLSIKGKLKNLKKNLYEQ